MYRTGYTTGMIEVITFVLIFVLIPSSFCVRRPQPDIHTRPCSWVNSTLSWEEKKQQPFHGQHFSAAPAVAASSFNFTIMNFLSPTFSQIVSPLHFAVMAVGTAHVHRRNDGRGVFCVCAERPWVSSTVQSCVRHRHHWTYYGVARWVSGNKCIGKGPL